MSSIDLVNWGGRDRIANLESQVSKVQNGGSIAADPPTGVSATDGPALVDAVAAAQAADKVLSLHPGNYHITSKLALTASNSRYRIAGAGKNLTTITQETDNVPVVELGNAGGSVYDSSITDVTLSYANVQDATKTGAVAVALAGTSWANLERLVITNSYKGIGVTANYGIASSSMRDVLVQTFSGVGIDLTVISGGIDGIDMSNIYVMSRDALGNLLPVTNCMKLSGIGNAKLSNIYLQTCKPSGSVLDCESNDTVTINGLHFENLTPTGDFQGFMFLSGGAYAVHGVLVAYNSLLVGNIPSAYAITRFGSNTKVMLDGLNSRNNTVTASYREFLDSGNTNTEIWVRGRSQTLDTTQLGFLPAPAILREMNGASGGVSGDRGDADVTLTVLADEPTQSFASALTVNRTVTLSTTSALKGHKFRIVRTGLGAFTLNVGGLKTIPAGTAAWVDVEFNGGAWVLTGYGTL